MKQKDVILRAYLSDSERYADLWNAYLGKEMFEAQKFEVMDAVGIQKEGRREKGRRIEHDLLKKHKKRERICFLGVENQEKVDYRMVLRSAGYTLETFNRQLKELEAIHLKNKDMESDEYLSRMKKTDRLYPVIILVLYFGREPWDGAKNLKELLKQDDYPEELRNIVPDYPMNLLEIQRFEHLERFQTDLYLVFGFLQRRWDKEKLREFIEENKEGFQDLREDAYDVIQAYGKVSALKKVKEVCRTETGGYDMCQAWNEIMEEERMKGKKMGLRLGEKKGERQGEKKGEERMGRLIEILAEKKDLEALKKVARNRTYRKKLYKELGI